MQERERETGKRLFRQVLNNKLLHFNGKYKMQQKQQQQNKKKEKKTIKI